MSGVVKKRGQLAVFVIIALVIVGMIAGYFLLRGNLFSTGSNSEFQPIFDQYSRCIEQETEAALDLAGSQGGRIYLDTYIPGSEYAPFASQLNFLGGPVPYWYYISGNGVIKENVPSKAGIEREMQRYISERINDCDFQTFYEQGYSIELGEPEAQVRITDEKVDVSVEGSVSASKEEESAGSESFSVSVNSKFGKYLGLARRIYDKEKEDAFLENYTADVLRLYAPVDGVEIKCTPQTWRTREVVDELHTGLENNIASIKLDGNYYTKTEKNKYFIVDLGTDESVNFIYSRNWPSKIEIYGEGVDQELMVAEPVGNQEGLGVMGFCYVPYHYVYDVSFPVMVQIYNNEEVFQFPVVVIIDKNLPRRAAFSTLNEEPEANICEYYTQDINVNVYDTNLNPVNANLSYVCFNQQCRLGETQGGSFTGSAPACVNGYIQARTEGYSEGKQLFSSNEETTADVILDKEYEVILDLKVGGNDLTDSAIIVFSGAQTASAVLPETQSVKLSEGLYNVSVYVYGNSSIDIPATTKTECREVPRSGFSGFFGGTKEECFDITIPATKIESSLTGGGRSELYLLASELEKGRALVNVEALAKPDSLEKLQYNYELFETMGVDIELR